MQKLFKRYRDYATYDPHLTTYGIVTFNFGRYVRGVKRTVDERTLPGAVSTFIHLCEFWTEAQTFSPDWHEYRMRTDHLYQLLVKQGHVRNRW